MADSEDVLVKAERVVNDYGLTMIRTAELQMRVAPLSMLPHPKERNTRGDSARSCSQSRSQLQFSNKRLHGPRYVHPRQHSRSCYRRFRSINVQRPSTLGQEVH